MKAALLVLHFLVTLLLIAGIILSSSKSEGLGALGGSSEVFRGSSAKGLDAIVEKWMVYLAYGFLVTSLLSYIFIF